MKYQLHILSTSIIIMNPGTDVRIEDQRAVTIVTKAVVEATVICLDVDEEIEYPLN